MAEATLAGAYEHNGRRVAAETFYAIACDPQRHVAVEACAGAGKTWMLVSRIVRALFDSLDPHTGALAVAPHEILAITFTKRAASEMRERLYRWLHEFANASETQLAHELRIRGVALGDDPARVRLQCSRLAGLYRAVLASGRPVQIRTFHSWFAAVLGAAPYAVLEHLALPLQYELLEDDAPARALVWRRFYQALLEQPERRADFEALVAEHGRFQTEKALGIALDKRIEFARADAAGRIEAAIAPFQALFPALAALAQPHDALTGAAVQARWLGWADALAAEANKTPRKAAQLVREAFLDLPQDGSPDQGGAAARLAMLRKALFVADEDRLLAHLQRYRAAQEAAAELGMLCAADQHHRAWAYQQRMARLTRVLLAQFAAIKREHGWVDMNDVERAALRLLSDPVLSGWVQERLDTRVRHLLIDEFQDTNPLQWQALLSWLGSYSGASSGAPGVFIVGDPKQSIYRFRRAEPQVFRAACGFIAQGMGGELLSCDHTRRNAPAVLELVNQVMAAAREQDRYDGFRRHTTDATVPGLVVRLEPIGRPGSGAAGGDAAQADGAQGDDAIDDATTQSGNGVVGDAPWRDSLTQPRTLPEETLRTLEARQVSWWIADAIARGRAASDVMVLSRRRAGLAPLQLELRARGIAAQIGEKTALIECCEVQDIVALLDVLVSPRHDLSLARALRSPLFAASDDALMALALRQRASGLSWFALLQQDEPQPAGLEGVGALLGQWQRLLEALPPHDALQAIYSQQDVLARFAVLAPPVQRAAVVANLRALLVAALDVAGGRFVTPYAFVRALKAGAISAAATITEDAVRLLTVHGAKGLEAGAVVLLDTDAAARASDTMGVLVDWPATAAQPQNFYFMRSEARPPSCALPTRDAELQQRQREELNTLYVAMTRARDTLVLSSIVPHRPSPASWWRRLSPRVPELDRPPAATLGGAGLNDVVAAFTLPVLPPVPDTVALPLAGAMAPAMAAVDGPADTVAERVGRAMHRLLEWGAVQEQGVAAVQREFGLDPEQARRAGAMARRILQGPAAWAWDVRELAWAGSEVELVHAGALLRLDRLVQRRDDGHWWVLDHKSSSDPMRDPSLVGQLGTYRAAVQAVYPGQTVRAAFLTGDGQWIELGQPCA